MNEDGKNKLLEKWCNTQQERGAQIASSEFCASYMKDVLSSLEHEADFNQFSDMKAHVDDMARREYILSRVGHAKAVAENFTPKAIKNLRPDVAGCVLAWQYSVGCFQGYYPISEIKPVKEGSKRKPKTHYSRSRSYNQKRTKVVALLEIVKWMWALHKENGGDIWQF